MWMLMTAACASSAAASIRKFREIIDEPAIGGDRRAAPESANMTPPRLREALPEGFEILDPVWIEMPDGVKLAARILLPHSAKTRPVPAILEYIPYRRRDGTLLGDTPRHAYFAGHGYAAVRVDLRGSGDSEGLLLD